MDFEAGDYYLPKTRRNRKRMSSQKRMEQREQEMLDEQREIEALQRNPHKTRRQVEEELESQRFTRQYKGGERGSRVPKYWMDW